MAQRRFWNWKDEDSTFDLSRWLVGLIESGVYRGFDADSFAVGMKLNLIHTDSGAYRTKLDRTMSAAFGVIVTKQGVVVQEDDAIELTINPSTTPRTDLIVFEHEYKEISGGIEGVYKVIEGDSTATVPALTNPNIQVAIGTIYLPANTTSLTATGVKFVKSKQPNFANSVAFIEKDGGFFISDLSGNGNRIINLGNPVNAQDATPKSYVDNSLLSAMIPATEVNRGLIELADNAEVDAEVDDVRAMTPKKTKRALDNRIATQQEVNNGTVDKSFITPKTLSGRTATIARTGVVKIADDTAADDPTNNSDAITPYQLHRVAGLSQKIIELGTWNMDADDLLEIPHTYSWWDKVVGSTVTIVDDSQVRYDMKFEEVSIDSDTIRLVKPSANYEGASFDSNGVNRGWIIFFVKNDLVAPPSSISSNAGVDQSGSYRILEYGTPVLNSVSATYSSGGQYPNTLPKLTANLTAGIGNSGGYWTIWAKRKNPVGTNSWNDWKDFTDLSVNAQTAEGYITDTGATNMDGQYYIKVKYHFLGLELESNVVEIALTGSVNLVGVASGNPQSTVTKVTWNLNGIVESLGSPLTDTTWSVVSAPAGASTVFGNASSPVTTFFGSAFGVYELKLSGTNAAGQTTEDTIMITITQILNVAPSAFVKWSDNTTAPKTVSWQVYNSSTGNWYGYYFANFNATASLDQDGYVEGYYWQFNFNNQGWQDLDSNAPSFPNTVTVNKQIQGDGLWKFRCKVKDNIGEISGWSNELELTISGSTTNTVPLNVFQLQVLSGGSGQWNMQAQLSISPVADVASLIMEIEYTCSGNKTNTDIYYKIVGNGQIAAYAGGGAFTQLPDVNLTSIKSSNMSILMDLRNIPPYKYATVRFKAYDAQNNLIGQQQFNMGNL